MAPLLDSHLDTAHPVLGGVADVHRVLDRMHAAALTGLGAHASTVAEVERAIRRLEALKLKLVAAAEQAGAPSDAGFTGTDAWVARHTRVSRSSAAHDVTLANELGSGHDLTAAALDEGLVSSAHAAVIVRAGHQLPSGVSEQQRRVVEESLVEQAQRHDPDQLQRLARRAIEAVEPDRVAVDAHENELVRSEEETACAKARLTFHDNGDGTVTGHFTIPVLAASILRKVIDSMTAPRRMREINERLPFDWPHRRGVAFAELVEHLPTDHLHEKTAATVVVTVDHTVLDGALRAAHLETGEVVSAGEARRLACGAGLIPAVLGGASVALDLGRETRLFSQAQRIAAGLRHDTCATDGCERPFAWCELHHREPWHQSGRTNLDNVVLLCHFHHRRIHDHAYAHRHLPDGRIRFTRKC